MNIDRAEIREKLKTLNKLSGYHWGLIVYPDYYALQVHAAGGATVVKSTHSSLKGALLQLDSTIADYSAD